MKKHIALAACTLAGLCLSLPAAAQFAKPEDAIKYRKAAFTLIGTHFGRLGAMAQGKMPYDAKAAAANAEVVAAVAGLPWVAFVEGTDKGETRAKPEIWQNMDKVKAAAQRMQDEVAKLNTVAKSGNFDALKAQVGETGKTCKGCHDDFRKE